MRAVADPIEVGAMADLRREFRSIAPGVRKAGGNRPGQPGQLDSGSTSTASGDSESDSETDS